MAQMHCGREDEHTIVAEDDGGSDPRGTPVRTDVIAETNAKFALAGDSVPVPFARFKSYLRRDMLLRTT